MPVASVFYFGLVQKLHTLIKLVYLPRSTLFIQVDFGLRQRRFGINLSNRLRFMQNKFGRLKYIYLLCDVLKQLT